MAWFLIMLLLVIADQISKIIIRHKVQFDESITVIKDFFYINNRVNKGAAWSFLANKDWGIYLLSAISFIASIVMVFLILKSNNNKFKFVMTLICAGSIGNLIDRILYKGVTDFLDFHFGNYIFPTFNIADSLIVCGSILLLVFALTDPHFLNDFSKNVQIEDKG